MQVKIYGDYLELDYGLNQNYGDDFTKKRLLEYAKGNAAKYDGLDNDEIKRFTKANTN